MEEPSREVLEAAHCWEASDRVPGDAVTIAFRRRARLHQARWRETHGHPIGSQPINPRAEATSRPVGARLPVGYARETGAAFVTPAARAAAEARTERKEAHQTFDRQRLWADLLWAPALAVNLFAGADDRAVRTWWPDAPGTVADVRFEHSPGRLDPAFLGNLSSFAAAVVLDQGDGTQGVVGIRALYADLVKREQPKPRNLARYQEVAERSGAFAHIPDGGRSDLTEIWLDHLLVHSMLQHPSAAWSWGRLVLLHPAPHAQAVDAARRYRELLQPDDTTFATMTLEDTLDGHRDAALRERYLVT
ncbi:MAG TPA: hypothetical protein VF228_15255 [Iamia sp.]